MEDSQKLKKFRLECKVAFPKSFSDTEEQLRLINNFSTCICNLFIPDLYCENMESWLSKDDQNAISVNYRMDVKELHENTGMTIEEFQADLSHLWKSIIFAHKKYVIVTDLKTIS